MPVSQATLVAPILASNTARIITIFGGNSYSLTGYRRLLKKYDLVIVIDVHGEIVRIFQDFQHPNLITVDLGEGETALSLVQDASPDLRAQVTRLPGLSTANGMAQLRAMGGCAADQLIASSRFSLLVLNEIVPRLMKSRPALRGASHAIHGGASGGTASLGMLKYGDGLAVALRFYLGVVVDTQFHVTGGVTSVDLGHNTRFNAAANIVDTADRMLRTPHSPREAWSVFFREHPAVGTDRTRRDLRVLMAEQALSAEEVEQVLMFRAPNQAGWGRCGNMSTLQFGFSRPLDPRFDVAPDNARCLSREVHRVLDAPVYPTVQELSTPTEEIELPQEPIEHLVDRVWDTDPDEWLEAAMQPGLEASAGVIALLDNGIGLNLLNTRRWCATPPLTGTAAAERLGMLRSCIIETSRSVQHARREVADLQLQLARVERSLKWYLGLVHPTTILLWLCALVTTVRFKQRRLARTTEQYRELDCELIVAAAQLAALEDADEQLRTERDFLEARLEQIDNALGRFLYRGEATRHQPYVTTLPLDDVFVDLWQLQPRDADEKVLKVICGATNQVTIDGLAKVVGVIEPRLDTIARHIASRQFVELGPAWGSHPRGLEPLCIHVLPPLDGDLAMTLRQMIRRLDGSTVCVADTAAAAVSLVDLYLEPVREVEDVLPPYYASGVVEIVRSPNWALFFPGGLDALNRLGIEIDGDQLKFQPLAS